jgi:XTP/dITP diphosphohydrolase
VAFPRQLALATKNPGKIREILAICRDWPVEQWRVASDSADSPATWPDVEETGQIYLENARLKAHATAKAFGIPALADDSGIEVDVLGGGPGARSARFAGDDATDEANLQLLIDRIRDVPSAERTARYRCVAVCAWPEGAEVSAEGVCEGLLITEPRGTGGFGYDPIFVPHGESRTMAELRDEEKNAVSHRGRAFRALRQTLEQASGPEAGPTT